MLSKTSVLRHDFQRKGSDTVEHKENNESVSTVSKIVYLNDENATFHAENGFLSLEAWLPKQDDLFEKEDLTEQPDENGFVTKKWERVFLHSAFPFDTPHEYISVLDKDSKEIGMIRALSELKKETQELLMAELSRKYYAPKITKILSVKERYGFSYWQVVLSDDRSFSFTVQDTYRSILRITYQHLFIIDVDGNRFEIPNVEALDRASYKKIELYL